MAKIPYIFTHRFRWLRETPERALDQAYKAAEMIKAIENKHFDGQKVASGYADYSENVISYFQGEVEKYLITIKLRLAEFKISGFLGRISDSSTQFLTDEDLLENNQFQEQSLAIINKLKYIDEVIHKYGQPVTKKQDVTILKQDNIKNQDNLVLNSNKNQKNNIQILPNNTSNKIETVSDKTGVLPRSILRTFGRIKQEIGPESGEAEAEVITNFRKSRNKTAISVRFLLILVIVPLLTHQLTKNFLVTPLIEKYFFTESSPQIFLNRDIEEETFDELKRFEEKLRIKSLIGLEASLSSQAIEEKVKERAETVVEEARHRGHEALSNIFADLFSLLSFAIVLIVSKKEIAVLKSFLDEIIYGLSDSAKAFLIILFTDIFVGFHSPHGWEIVLEGLARHLGLPESREFNFLFIATFPVILDTVLKYWIFRYLNRISPSAVATYRNMNE